MDEPLYTRNRAGFFSAIAIAVLAGVLGWSGIVKLLDPDAFTLAIYRYHLLPSWAVNVASLWISMLE